MRTSEDQAALRSWLTYIGNGEQGRETAKISIPNENVAQSLDDAIDFCFPPNLFVDPLMHGNIFSASGILCPTNRAVLWINEKTMQKIRGEARAHRSLDAPLKSGNNMTGYRADFNLEVIHNETPTGLPPHLLNLKVFFQE